jgi:hypothetical protein
VPDEKSAAAEPIHPGFDDRCDRGRDNRGVDRVATIFEHPGAELRRKWCLGRYYAGLGNRLESSQPPTAD